jgi:hypothetical protein
VEDQLGDQTRLVGPGGGPHPLKEKSNPIISCQATPPICVSVHSDSRNGPSVPPLPRGKTAQPMGDFPVCWNPILCGSARTLHLFSMFRFDLFSTRFAARPRSVDKRRAAIGTWFLLPGASRWPIADQRGWFSSRHGCGRSRPLPGMQEPPWAVGGSGAWTGRDNRARSGHARKAVARGLQRAIGGEPSHAVLAVRC